jgi:hypothetical protein
MPCENPHCPFLNRDDARCSTRFSVGNMEYAFSHCFENYKACPTYLELLVERRVRRMSEAVIHGHVAREIAPIHVSRVEVTVGGKSYAA